MIGTKIGKLIIILSILCTKSVYAKCNYSLDIVKLDNSDYIYSKECHSEFGYTLDLNDLLKMKVTNLESAISKKDEEIDMLNQYIDIEKERSLMWKDSAEKYHKKLEREQKFDLLENTLYALGGSIFTALIVGLIGGI